MSYIRSLPTEMIQAKYDEYKALYEKFEKLYASMRSRRSQYNMSEIDFHKKLGYYRSMSNIYKKQAYDCRMFLLDGPKKSY